MGINTDISNNLLYKQSNVEYALNNGLTDRIRDTCPKVSVEENISVEDFRKNYVDLSKPVVLRGLKTSKQDIDLDFFSREAGDIEVCINLYDTKNSIKANISQLAERIKASSEDDPVYLQEWWFEKDFPAFMETFSIPEYFADDWGKKVLGCSPLTLWIGSKGAITPIHEDTGHFNLCTAQLFGSKEWFLFNKDATLKAGSNGEPDYEEFLSNTATQAQSCILEKGDVLFMPYKWWHRTITLEHSASFNMPYLTEDTIQQYTKAIFTLPMLLALRADELKRHNPMRYNVTKQRVEMLAHHMSFDPDYVINAIKNADTESKQAA